jgi:rod shape-determining protein MreD
MFGLRFRLPLLLFLALVVHTTLLPDFRIAGVMPDLMLLLPIAAGLDAGPTYGAVVGFTSGMLADLVVQSPLGLSALVFTVVGYAVGITKAGILRDAWWFAPAVALVASSAGEGLFALASTIVGQSLLTAHLPTIMLVVGVTNGVLALAVQPVVRWALSSRPPARAYAE